ncbi:MAG: hypothetical protein M0T70_02925 [Geobacteraceae bacterium]|nr:hypothetical protein [Geobacteraceae bacterium]
MKYINLCTVFMVLCSAAVAMAGGYYFEKPELQTVPDGARILVYDADTKTDKNFSGTFLKGFFTQSTDPRLTDARAPLPHNQAASTITGLAEAVFGASPVQSVAGKIGAVTLTPLDIGLEETCTGRVSTDGIDGSMIYTGSTAPAADLGVERDIYVRTNGDLYRKEGDPVAWVWKTNLTGPASTEPGPPGPANTLGVGTVTTGNPGTPAAASVTGVSPSQTLNLTIPKGDAGPATTLTIGTVTTGAPGTPVVATITGTAPNYTLSLTIPQGDPGSSTISRDQMTTTMDNPSDTVVYLQPATNSPTAGGLVINDYFGNAAVIIRNGAVEVRDTSGVTIAKIDRAAGSIASYDSAGNIVAKMDRTGFYTLNADGSAGMTWTRATKALVIQ